MAAIAGVLRFDGNPSAEADVRAVMASMSHRAPGGARICGDVEFALAHGALLSTPESIHERQPVVIGERWMLAVDGRIDNRKSLAREFGLDDIDSSRLGDDALFARAWLRWGEDFWQHVDGEFALAVWDRQARGLRLLRDRVGQRPLYYAQSGKLVAFASEPEPLLGLDGISRVCNQDGLAYLVSANFQPEDRDTTFYRDVRRLQPGAVLQVAATGQLHVDRYWSMRPGAMLILRDSREYVDAFREVFGAAVQSRLRSLHRPALMLSGGIDSASVLGAVRLPGGAATSLLPISMVAEPGQDCDETPNILRMHGTGDGIRLPVEHLAGHALSAALVEAAWGRAHPIDNSLLYARLVHLAARDAGSNVVFDGADGDVIMHADNNPAGALALAGHPLRAWREASRASVVNTYLRGLPPWRILLHGIAGRMQPDWLAASRYRLHHRRHGDEMQGPLIDRGFAMRLRLRERNLEMALRERSTRGSRQANLIASWWGPGITRSLEGTDRTAACFGVEARHPWCDQRVLEFFLGLPEEFVVRDGWTKWIARSAYAGVLGDSVAWHSGKHHLGPHVTRHVLSLSAERVSALLDRAGERLDGVIDARALQGLRASWASRRSGPGNVDIEQVFQTATLVAWIDRFGLSAS